MPSDWVEPLSFAQRYAGYDSLILLHSSLAHERFGRKSILAVGLEQEITETSALEKQLANNTSTEWHERHFGYFGYEAFEEDSNTSESHIRFPSLWFGKFASVWVFDHQSQTIEHYGSAIKEKPLRDPSKETAISKLTSNMTREEYLHHIEATLEQIAAGEFYQANITRKFSGEFADTPNGLPLFAKLCEVSPGFYSSYMKLPMGEILSSSPECFLTIDSTGTVETRPIKGTAPRHTSPQALSESAKDRAENLMIVDLMRNDLSKHCDIGSVKTEKLFEVTSYATLHHMDSTITGKRNANSDSLTLIQGCFPPGSMTGAPKRAVIEWCREVEQQKRGIYSGALGWIAGDGSADLSVVIRTLLLQGKAFEFQVGGGIVYDSVPEKEWEETLTKAQGICRCLNLPVDKLAEL
jgi:para-aminobenzoate synthetase component 1